MDSAVPGGRGEGGREVRPGEGGGVARPWSHQSMGNLSAMIKRQEPTVYVEDSTLFIEYLMVGEYARSHQERLLLDMKGRDLQYEKILTLVKSIDFSDNKLSGEIPAELTDLVQLQGLKLSNNQFIGKIPEKIGNI